MSDNDLYREIQRMNGVVNPPELPHPSQWRLHLKEVTPVDLEAVLRLPTFHSETHRKLGRRQSLKKAKYMIQIDFEAFYDAIPIPPSTRKHFVFRKGPEYFQLCTLPTGARWSVAVGQAITRTIVDIDTPVIVHTMIDNVLVAAHEGEEKQFNEPFVKLCRGSARQT